MVGAGSRVEWGCRVGRRKVEGASGLECEKRG